VSPFVLQKSRRCHSIMFPKCGVCPMPRPRSSVVLYMPFGNTSMEVSIAQSLEADSEGRGMMLRTDSARRYDATAMAASYDRRLDNYWTAKGTVDIMNAISRAEGVSVSELRTTVTTGPIELRGTWVHEDLALHLAAWNDAPYQKGFNPLDPTA